MIEFENSFSDRRDYTLDGKRFSLRKLYNYIIVSDCTGGGVVMLFDVASQSINK